jgi:hypothetical protein
MGYFLNKLDKWALSDFDENFAELKSMHMACQIVIAEKLGDRLSKLKEAIKSSDGDASLAFKNEALHAGKQIKFFKDAVKKKESWANICNLVEANIAQSYCHCMRAEDLKIILSVDTRIENFIAEVKVQSFLYEPAIQEIKSS